MRGAVLFYLYRMVVLALGALVVVGRAAAFTRCSSLAAAAAAKQRQRCGSSVRLLSRGHRPPAKQVVEEGHDVVEISPSNHGTRPLTSFLDGGAAAKLLDSRLRRNLRRLRPRQGRTTTTTTTTTTIARPTPIQAHAVPLLLRGSDVMASAPTGSGKSLMFGLPLCQALLLRDNYDKNNKQHHKNNSTHAMRRRQQSSSSSSSTPRALILNPTRELAQQTADVLRQLCGRAGGGDGDDTTDLLTVALATGGASVARQRRELLHNKGGTGSVDIVVGTPGRVQQLLDERTLRLDRVQFAVVDEADRLLDLGFEPQLRRIARSLPGPRTGAGGGGSSNSSSSSASKRQTVLCSATFPSEVQRLGSLFLRPDYYFVAAGRVGGLPPRIAQQLVWVGSGSSSSNNYYRNKNYNQNNNQNNNHNHHRRKLVQRHVQDFLRKNNPSSRVIVFCNTKDECERMGAALMRNNNSSSNNNSKKQRGNNNNNSNHAAVAVVTGDKSQAERNRSLAQFRRGQISVLVATDVAARGLDVPEVGLVVQAEAPRDADTFVHRVGRTGRGPDGSGAAVALLDGRNTGVAPDLVDLLHHARQPVPAWLRGMAHVARAKRLDEEGAIAAGGGGDSSSGSSPLTNNEGENEHAFSGQDFRRSANPGSWGSERDTSFHEFDKEAYSSLEAAQAAAFVDDITDNGDDDVTALDEAEATSVSSAGVTVEDAAVAAVDDDDDDARKDPMEQEDQTTEAASFARPPASRELSEAIRRLTGSAEIGAKPRQDVLNALSKKGADQKLRFEYIGMFPFAMIVDHLSSRSIDSQSNNRGSDLPRVLMVAEKPSIAKAIADALSGPRGPRQRRGISPALPVYEFTSGDFAPAADDPLNTIGSARVMCTVTSVVGHIFSLGFAEETAPDGTRRRLDPSEYFDLPVVKQEETTTGKLRVIEHLRALAATCDHLVLWLDCDAEGENIAFETIGVTRRAFDQKVAQEMAVNSDGPPVRRIHRAHFSAITRQALRDAFQKLGEPDAALSRSVDARQELDLRVGVAMTRLLTWRCVGLARQRYSPATRFISYGPCQTPTLSFCVDRAREIESFKPQKYYKVHTTVKLPGDTRATYQLKWKPATDLVQSTSKKAGYRKRSDSEMQYEESATFDEKSAAHVVRLSSCPGSILRVSQLDTTTERVRAPLGLNTVALLSAGSKSMGMSPKKVMNVAEQLYSSGYLSYPRTESTRYDPTGFDVRTILQEHANHPEWGRTAAHLLRKKYYAHGKPPMRGDDAGDHPPITCLKSATRDEIGGGAAWRVYEFVSRNMLGSFSDDLFFTRKVATLELVAGTSSDEPVATNRPPSFELEEVTVDTLGFADACTWVLKDIGARNGNKKETNGLVGGRVELSEGMALSVDDIEYEACHTKPPRFLQEHELIELMDEHRVGTDASMATHVTNIVDRGYVVLCDETGTELRPPRPPRPGQSRPPRQIGRYMVPTPLGLSFMDLFGCQASDKQSAVALLARPEIRAQMEAECSSIAKGELDKETCVATNLKWFQSRHKELDSSLTPAFLNKQFGRKLQPTKDGLRYWRQFGVFVDRKVPLNASGAASRKARGGLGRTHRSHGNRKMTKGRKHHPEKSRNAEASKEARSYSESRRPRHVRQN